MVEDKKGIVRMKLRRKPGTNQAKRKPIRDVMEYIHVNPDGERDVAVEMDHPGDLGRGWWFRYC